MDMEPTVLEGPVPPVVTDAKSTDAVVPVPESISSVAKRMSAQSCFERAEALWNGTREWPVNRGEAALWFEQAADKGMPAAMFEFAECLRWGDGVARSPKRAEMLYRLAAEAGEQRAIHWLAHAYAAGDGVHPDPKEAAKWQQKAGTYSHVSLGWALALVALGALVASLGYWWLAR